MPQLEWDETDFLECFEVEPEAADHDVSHTYDMNANGLRLLVTVWQYESVVQVSLYRREHEDAAITTLACFVRGNARYVNDKRGMYIELANCVIGPSRFWYQETGDLFDQESFAHGVDVHLGIKPDLRVHVVARR